MLQETIQGMATGEAGSQTTTGQEPVERPAEINDTSPMTIDAFQEIVHGTAPEYPVDQELIRLLHNSLMTPEEGQLPTNCTMQ